MLQVSNQLLYQQKLQALELFKKNFNSDLFVHSVVCDYHGVSLKISSQSAKLKKSIEDYIPSTWLKEQSPAYEVYLLTPEFFHYSLESWCLESSQDCYSLDNNQIAIQRDFASAFISENKILLICEDIVSDGFHNFLRWFISERLIAQNKYVIHASCVLDKNNLAHVFLGHSGAGKTTITQLSAPRLTLGDDMNIMSFDRGDLVVEAGAIGSLFNSMIGYDKKIKVKACYWLNQALENNLEKLPATVAHQKLLASFANLNWSTVSDEMANKLVDFSSKAVDATEFYELEFKNDSSVWEMLDP